MKEILPENEVAIIDLKSTIEKKLNKFLFNPVNEEAFINIQKELENLQFLFSSYGPKYKVELIPEEALPNQIKFKISV